jgi:hypothetical protein
MDAAVDTVQELNRGDVRVRDPFSSGAKTLGSVQAWRLEFSDLPSCIGKVTDQEFFGTGFRVLGVASRPVSTTERFGPFEGSTQTWAMPYVGNLPGAGQNLGAFELSGLITGSFARPAALASDVDAGRVPLNMTMRDARPPTVGVDRAEWHEISPFQPTVRVQDSSHLALQQRLSTVSTMVLGLAGAILTAYVFEFVRGRPAFGQVRPGHTEEQESRGDGQLAVRDPAKNDRRRWLPVMVVILPILVRLLRRLRRHRN